MKERIEYISPDGEHVTAYIACQGDAELLEQLGYTKVEEPL